MKYIKILGLAALVAAALMALGASNASATVFCKETPTGGSTGTQGTVCPSAYGAGTVIHAVATKTMTLLTEFQTIECTGSTLQGTTKNEGSATETVTLQVETLTFEGCNCEIKTLKGGTQEAHWIADTFNGTITSSGQEITANCHDIFGTVHCIYATNNTHLGEAKGSPTDTSAATLHIESANIPRLETNPLCAAEAAWTATYETTSPKPLWFASHT